MTDSSITPDEIAQWAAQPDVTKGRTTIDETYNGATGLTHHSEPDGAALLDDLRRFLSRYIIHPNAESLVAHTLWIAHTWFMDHWESTPRIAFLSPEPGSGKSRALEVTEPLVPRPVHAVNVSPAYLFRKVSDPEGRPTILYDEVDTIFGPKAKDNEDIRGMLNAGHRKGATAGRCVIRGKTVDTEELPAYCAVALAGLDDLPDTIASRAVVIRMKRRAPGETVEPWRPRLNHPEAHKLRDRLATWAASLAEKLAGDWWPVMPPEVTDRDADVWEALLAVAELAGGHWPNTARVAAVTAVTASRQKQPSVGVLLLRDIRKAFDQLGGDVLRADQLLPVLNGMDTAPWSSCRRGEPLDPRGLSTRLGKFSIGPKAHRVGTSVVKGYRRAQFEDAWSRYLVDLPDDDAEDSSSQYRDSPVTSVTQLQPNGFNGSATSAVAAVTAVTGYLPLEAAKAEVVERRSAKQPADG